MVTCSPNHTSSVEHVYTLISNVSMCMGCLQQDRMSWDSDSQYTIVNVIHTYTHTQYLPTPTPTPTPKKAQAFNLKQSLRVSQQLAESVKYCPLILNNVRLEHLSNTPLSLRIMDLPIGHFTLEAGMDLPLRK